MIVSTGDCGAVYPPWFGLQTKPRSEKAAAMQLEIRGYRVFLPVYRKATKWSDRVMQLDYPLFPGYLFCGVDFTCPSRVVATPGIVHIVGCGGHPEPIPEHEIEAIRIMLQSGLLIEPHPYLREGERIVITKGPLKGIDGVVIRRKSTLTVVASVELLQRSLSIEFASDTVEVNSIAGKPSLHSNLLREDFGPS